jgi:hypothetical protein
MVPGMLIDAFASKDGTSLQDKLSINKVALAIEASGVDGRHIDRANKRIGILLI